MANIFVDRFLLLKSIVPSIVVTTLQSVRLSFVVRPVNRKSNSSLDVLRSQEENLEAAGIFLVVERLMESYYEKSSGLV
jgi:hypothetical protein